jgi:hypothetical protein
MLALTWRRLWGKAAQLYPSYVLPRSRKTAGSYELLPTSSTETTEKHMPKPPNLRPNGLLYVVMLLLLLFSGVTAGTLWSKQSDLEGRCDSKETVIQMTYLEI